jgi:hypothetical protein
VEAIKKHLQDFAYPGQAVRDPEHHLVRLTHAEVTPEAVVFNQDREIMYRGRIDDTYVDFGQARPAPTRRDLAEALDATLEGRPVAQPETKAIGCYIDDLE